MKYDAQTFRMETLQKAESFWYDKNDNMVIIKGIDQKFHRYPATDENKNKIREFRNLIGKPGNIKAICRVNQPVRRGPWVPYSTWHLAYDRILKLKREYDAKGFDTKIYSVVYEKGKKFAKLKLREKLN